MKPWEVIATLITAKQLVVVTPVMEGGGTCLPYAAIQCPRTKKLVTLDNVRTIQVEHWPQRHKHGGPVSPDNAVISLAEGHKEQTRREKKADAKEDRIRQGRKILVDLEKKARGKKPTGYRYKRKIDGRVVKVPKYD